MFFEFIPNLATLLNPSPTSKQKSFSWTDVHTEIVKQIKRQVRELSCLNLPIPSAFKIVETDASELGYGGSSTPKPESSTPKTESQTQRLTSSKPGRKTTDSYTKKPPNQTWEEVLAKKDNKTQALEHDRALALSLVASSSQAINKQEYDLANAKFALELAQKRPPQVPPPLLVTPANNPMDTPYIAKLEQVKHVLQLEPEFFFGTPNELSISRHSILRLSSRVLELRCMLLSADDVKVIVAIFSPLTQGGW
ncbi:hypothetical protein K1719_012215 [Acacia pycnantha]|nr:hypothetical protein K1719_012215 [Acacia pycnantha]